MIFYLLQWITWGITLVLWRGVYCFLMVAFGRVHSYPLHLGLYAAMEVFDIVLHFLCTEGSRFLLWVILSILRDGDGGQFRQRARVRFHA